MFTRTTHTVTINLQRVLLISLLLLGLLSAGTAAAQDDVYASPNDPAPSTDLSDVVNRVVARTNMYRARFGCPALVLSEQLNSSAQSHSDDMAQNDFFAHASSNGASPFDRMRATGYPFRLAAENIAAGYDTPEDVVDGWFNEVPPDDGHRLNILNCNLHEIGIGYTYLAEDPGNIQYQSYWTQDFGTRR